MCVTSGTRVTLEFTPKIQRAACVPRVARVLARRAPGGEGIRVDGSLADGGTIPTHFDPMLAPVIAFGPARPTMLSHVDRTLANTVVFGVAPTISFLRRTLLEFPQVRCGVRDTGWIERELPSLARRHDQVPGAKEDPA